MGCCGKTAKKIAKGIDIGTAYAKYATGKKCVYTDSRIRQCHKCDKQTWMSRAEYAGWLKKHKIEVLKNFHQLEKLPELPKRDIAKGRRNLFCRICKCFIPAKAGSEKEKCPLGNWDNLADTKKEDIELLELPEIDPMTGKESIKGYIILVTDKQKAEQLTKVLTTLLRSEEENESNRKSAGQNKS